MILTRRALFCPLGLYEREKPQDKASCWAAWNFFHLIRERAAKEQKNQGRQQNVKE
jgi:hypothetical protein